VILSPRSSASDPFCCDRESTRNGRPATPGSFPWDNTPRYLLRDRDGIYGEKVHEATEWLGLREVLAASEITLQILTSSV